MQRLFFEFINDIRATGMLEYLAVFSGILSVWFSKKESVWVYPVGLLNTGIYIYLSAKASLFGESVVNGYYTLMSLYGWWGWLQKDRYSHQYSLRITRSDRRWVIIQWAFFISIFITSLGALIYLKTKFYPSAVPWADSLATASAFTGMWLMTRKKLESWYWWMATNIISVPLYIYKGYTLTGVYYIILFVLAIAGLREWRKKNDL